MTDMNDAASACISENIVSYQKNITLIASVNVEIENRFRVLSPGKKQIMQSMFKYLFGCNKSQLQHLEAFIVACGIKLPDQGSIPGLPTLETQSFSHWATREVLEPLLQICVKPTKLSLCWKEKRGRENVEKNLVWEVWRRHIGHHHLASLHLGFGNQYSHTLMPSM